MSGSDKKGREELLLGDGVGERNSTLTFRVVIDGATRWIIANRVDLLKLLGSD